MTSAIREDCEALAKSMEIDWCRFAGAIVVVTGATGLIGKTLVATMLAREAAEPSGMRVVALVRDVNKARGLFGEEPALIIHAWDASNPAVDETTVARADYIFHCANMTDSSSFVQKPVEVIQTTVGGAQAMIDVARRTNATLCLLSTMETYGEVSLGHPTAEDQGGFLDAMVVRNSYPEAKRLVEALAAAYSSEYSLNIMCARLTQTFGPGVAKDDSRVFAYFARCALQGDDIVMLTDGTKRNAYLYTADAVSALLCIATRGVSGRAYNVANDETFCEVREMASMVARCFGKGNVSVRFEIDDDAAACFRKGSMLRLDTSALRSLGWAPKQGLEHMYRRMMLDWQG